MNRTFRVATAGPDKMTEELVAALAATTWFEFKPLFLLVHASLQQRRSAHGGEEMLRLRAYDKLQGLVQNGLVERVGKLYRGRTEKLAAFTENVAAQYSQSLMAAAARAK